MTTPPAGPARQPPPGPVRLPLLPARIGALLATPERALAFIDQHGGGLRDALWMVVLGILCFRLEDLARALVSITHISFGTVLRQMLAVASAEMREAVQVVLPAAVLVTFFAGRGRRDPSRDLELGAACYVPFFAVRAVYRTAALDMFFGPLPRVANQVASGLAAAWAIGVLLLAVRRARARAIPATTSATPVQEGAPAAETAPLAASPAAPAAQSPTRVRAAAALLAAVLGQALVVNAAWVAVHGDAIRPLERGAEAPGFALPRLDTGKGDLALASLRGKVVLIDFWATWCAPCVQMLPVLHALHDEWRERGVEFVGINADGPMATADELKGFLRAHPVPYPVVLDAEGEAARLYKVVALPHMVLLDRSGAVRKTFWGYTSQKELALALAGLME